MSNRNLLHQFRLNFVKNYSGDLKVLANILGFLEVCNLFGWKVARLNYSKATFRKYEKLLGITIRDKFTSEGLYTYKSVGFEQSLEASNFWKYASGSDPLLIDKRNLLR